MPIEMAVLTFDGTHAAERELSVLRASRDDAWLGEVAVLEHHAGGRYSMKATSPGYRDKDHLAAAAATGGLTGLCLGAIARPLGLISWSSMAGLTGAALRDTGRPGAFGPLVDRVKDALPRGSSALILVAEPALAELLISVVGPRARVSRQLLTDEQVERLIEAAVAS
jgi:hypothetical protein